MFSALAGGNIFPLEMFHVRSWDFTDDFDFSYINPTHVPSGGFYYNSSSSYTYNRERMIKYVIKISQGKMYFIFYEY